MVEGRWTQAGKDKLASSGLTVKDASVMGMYEVPSAMLVHKSLEALPAIILPYHDLKGKLAKSHPLWPDFFRVRYLGKGNSFVDMATEKSQRYAQPAKSGVCAYFPKLMDWELIAADSATPIIITEGEFKAAAGCIAEWATIGLGGVWNFRASGEGFFFLPELEKINWVKREVYICFDSDYVEKPQVCHAMNMLGEELLERGALPSALLLPDVREDGKTGLDDYLLVAKEGEFEQLVATAQPLTLARALWSMNKNVAYVNNPGMVVQLDNALKMTPSAFKEHSKWSTMVSSEQRIDAEGNLSIKKVPAAPLWLKWPLRRSVESVTYAPGEERITDENKFNQWPGWGVKPRKGDVKPFIELTKFLFKDMEKGMLEWFYDWLAYPIQNPGIKMFSCVVVWGPEEGTGKSFIGYTMGRLYGENFKELTDEELEGDYTAWAENKSFVMGDEITGTDNRQYANKLKRLITQRSISINIKHVPQYTVPDCINYFFTSNHADAFFMSDKDRRMFIVEVVGPPLPDKFYNDYEKWLWGQGAAALMHWLLERKISKDFNPSARPPRTGAKDRMIAAGKGELGNWIAELLEHPSQVLITGKMRHTRDLWSAGELLSFYQSRYPNSKVTAIGIGKALSNAGVAQADNGRSLRAPDGTMNRYYIIRNVDRWRKSDRKKLEANLKSPPVVRTGFEGKV